MPSLRPAAAGRRALIARLGALLLAPLGRRARRLRRRRGVRRRDTDEGARADDP